MQGKGIVRFFLILLTVVCGLQYLYLFPTRKIEKKADEYAASASASITDEAAKSMAYKMARTAYLDSMSSEPVVKIPLLGDFSYEKLKRQQIALGLDLKGGISTVLQVNLRDFIETLSNGTKDPTFKQALDNADLAMKNAQTDYINLFGQEWAKIAGDKKLAPIFTRNPTMREVITFETSDADVIGVLRKKANETVDLTFKRLKDRIDKLGVVQPNVSLDNTRDLILVELPGVDNPERARSFLQSTAKLEFWDVYRISDPGIMEAFVNADARLKQISAGDTSQTMALDTTTRIDTTYKDVVDSLGNVVDSTPVYTRVPVNPDTSSAVGPLLSILDMNSSNGQTIQYQLPVMGVANKNKINAINDMLANPQVKNIFPQDVKFMWSKKPYTDAKGLETDQFELYAIKMKRGSEQAPLQGDRVITATSSPDPMTSEVVVNLKMDNLGAKIWSEMTTKAAQDNNREVAIALDDEIVSAPRVNEPITTGSSRISGNFTIQEGQDLASILQIGKLPASTSIVQEALVGPSLGKENINKSMVAMAVSLLLVLVFMIFYYNGGGLVAIIALIANLFFIFGALSSIGTVLTLPGIAGIVLTMGMAVDANVIINERIREELRAGKSLKTAISEGFKHSYAAIIDSNVTTILSSLALMYFGLGPIKGFAVVLLIGIMTSMFTAVLLARLMTDWWVGKGKNIHFYIPMTKDLFTNIHIDWISKRKYAYIISIALTVIGLVSMFTRGFDLGVDFKGGYSYNVEFAKDVKVSGDDLRAELTKQFGSAPVVKSIDAYNSFNVTTSYKVDETGQAAHDEVTAKLFDGVNNLAGGNLQLESFKQTDAPGTHITSSSKVGATIADDIQKSSFLAGFWALLLIFVYIFIRFNRWQYSFAAIVATFHDAFLVVMAFSLLHGFMPFSMEVDQTFIAAVLTIIGYSLNDTVIIFDRIRENFNLFPGKPKKEIINQSLNATLSRSIITHLTVLFVVVVLLVFGGASIKGFAFALVIGVVVGTYSSIFIAAPLLNDLSGEIKPKASYIHAVKKPAGVK
ncbi:MAG TPA: protein translocase subunit SecDF [Saprospiraceae bacterium]|nr:protein translocase subunit SecDF [Saprospiraceae bacterium]